LEVQGSEGLKGQGLEGQGSRDNSSGLTLVLDWVFSHGPVHVVEIVVVAVRVVVAPLGVPVLVAHVYLETRGNGMRGFGVQAFRV